MKQSLYNWVGFHPLIHPKNQQPGALFPYVFHIFSHFSSQKKTAQVHISLRRISTFHFGPQHGPLPRDPFRPPTGWPKTPNWLANFYDPYPYAFLGIQGSWMGMSLHNLFLWCKFCEDSWMFMVKFGETSE